MTAAPLDLATVSLTPATHLDAGDFRALWIDDWYDGPLSSMIARGEERLYLEVHDRAVLGSDEPSRWCVLRLTPEALAEQEAQHDLFAFHVGEHWCSHVAPHRAHEGVRSADRFYELQRGRSPLTTADFEVIGWLDEPPRPERHKPL